MSMQANSRNNIQGLTSSVIETIKQLKTSIAERHHPISALQCQLNTVCNEVAYIINNQSKLGIDLRSRLRRYIKDLILTLSEQKSENLDVTRLSEIYEQFAGTKRKQYDPHHEFLSKSLADFKDKAMTLIQNLQNLEFQEIFCHAIDPEFVTFFKEYKRSYMQLRKTAKLLLEEDRYPIIQIGKIIASCYTHIESVMLPLTCRFHYFECVFRLNGASPSTDMLPFVCNKLSLSLQSALPEHIEQISFENAEYIIEYLTVLTTTINSFDPSSIADYIPELCKNLTRCIEHLDELVEFELFNPVIQKEYIDAIIKLSRLHSNHDEPHTLLTVLQNIVTDPLLGFKLKKAAISHHQSHQPIKQPPSPKKFSDSSSEHTMALK